MLAPLIAGALALRFGATGGGFGLTTVVAGPGTGAPEPPASLLLAAGLLLLAGARRSSPARPAS